VELFPVLPAEHQGDGAAHLGQVDGEVDREDQDGQGVEDERGERPDDPHQGARHIRAELVDLLPDVSELCEEGELLLGSFVILGRAFDQSGDLPYDVREHEPEEKR
jgi:hypothetical protein